MSTPPDMRIALVQSDGAAVVPDLAIGFEDHDAHGGSYPQASPDRLLTSNGTTFRLGAPGNEIAASAGHRSGVRMKLTRARLPSTISWVGAVSIVVGCEVVLLLWLRSFPLPVDAPPEVYLAYHELLLGKPGEHIGVLRPLSVLNPIAVAALWVAFRAARRERARDAQAAALGASIVFALLSYVVAELGATIPALRVRERIELGPDGTYRTATFLEPGAPLEVQNTQAGSDHPGRAAR